MEHSLKLGQRYITYDNTYDVVLMFFYWWSGPFQVKFVIGTSISAAASTFINLAIGSERIQTSQSYVAGCCTLTKDRCETG
jgi:hypothetical protein